MLAAVAGLCLGTCLSLWLSSRVVERLLTKLTELTNQVVRETAVAINPPPQQPISQPAMYQTAELPNDIDPDEMPPWASPGMTWDDLREGIDPLTGRPLR